MVILWKFQRLGFRSKASLVNYDLKIQVSMSSIANSTSFRDYNNKGQFGTFGRLKVAPFIISDCSIDSLLQIILQLTNSYDRIMSVKP